MATTDDHDPSGHYRTAGYAVLAMGGLAALLYIAVITTQVELGFIDASGIAGIGIAFAVVGGLLVATGSRE